jgi:hypothetical protein
MSQDLRQQVEDLVVQLFCATDERDWPAVQACFTDPLLLDMTSLGGGEPLKLAPAALTAAWAKGLEKLDHVHHQVGNFRTRVGSDVRGHNATVRCYGVAWHHRANIASERKSRYFVGSYEFRLARAQGEWRITEMHYFLKFIEGNRELETTL